MLKENTGTHVLLYVFNFISARLSFYGILTLYQLDRPQCSVH